jgi:TrmH family RNA methyltransferase
VDEILRALNPLVVVVCRLQDPGNVGTILRVAESFSASGCVATAGTVSVYNTKVTRASAGSVFRLPHVWGMESETIFTAMRDRGIAVIGTSPSAPETVETWNWRTPAAVVVGNEGSGLSETELGWCDVVLRIPINPAVDSLNSAVAASVILYEAATQRQAS